MIISCPSCSIKYFVNKEVLLKKTKLKCSDCGHEWVYNYKLESSIKNQNNELEEKQDISQKILNIKQNEFPIDDSFVSKSKKNWLFLFFLFFFTILFSSIIYFKEEIIIYFPKTKQFYLLTGLENEEIKQNLILKNIEKDVNILNDNSKVVTISGKINNISDKNEKIPRLQASLLDSKNNILSSWFFYAEKEVLLPKENTNFETSYISKKDEDIVEIKIDFFLEDADK